MMPFTSRASRLAPFLGLLLLPALVAGSPAAAGVFEGNGEIGFDLGVADGDGQDTNEGRFAIRGGYHLNDRFQLEAQIFGVNSDRFDGEALGAAFANAVFNWHPNETIVPYVLAGVGVVSLGFDDHRHHQHGRHHRHDYHSYDDDYEGRGAVQVGVGSRFFFGKGAATAVRIEASLLAFEDNFERERDLLSLTVGLTWRLGKYRPPKVTVVGE